MSFHAEMRRYREIAILDLSGDLNGAADAQLAAAYDDVASFGTAPLILNFADVGYINSTGIAVVVGILGRAQSEGRDMRAIGLSEHYRHIFEITRLADFIPVYEDEAAAINGATPATA